MLHSTSNGYSGLQSFSWDSTTNNGATTFDNVSNFVFNKDTLQNSVQFNSESLVTDFELDNGQFDNTTNNFDDLGNALTWDYNKIDFKELDEGPDECAPGDMCWGTNILMEIIQTTLIQRSESLH